MNEMERLHNEMSRWMEELRRNALGIRGATGQWRPAMNAYRLADRVVLCLDLAGMKKSDISVRVEGRRLVITGTRPAPEPPRGSSEHTQTLALEIDAGPFERILELPATVDAETVTAHYREGLLWVTLPLQPATRTIHPREETPQ